jgi:lipoate-protein ligase B
MPKTSPFQVTNLGLIDYHRAYSFQKEAVDHLLQGGPQVLFLCEHPIVITLGRLGEKSNIFFSKEELEKRGIEIVSIDRGGEVTLHAPGQLVVYPIFNLSRYGKDLHQFLHKLEQVAIDLLADFDIVANRISGRRGVWVKGRKIASIGIGVRKWISFHGLGLNINTDLNLFSMIKPCGLDVVMTSLRAIHKKDIDMEEVKAKMISCFERHFQEGLWKKL